MHFQVFNYLVCYISFCACACSAKLKLHGNSSFPQKIPSSAWNTSLGCTSMAYLHHYATLCMMHALQLAWQGLGQNCNLACPDWEEFLLEVSPCWIDAVFLIARQISFFKTEGTVAVVTAVFSATLVTDWAFREGDLKDTGVKSECFRQRGVCFCNGQYGKDTMFLNIKARRHIWI